MFKKLIMPLIIAAIGSAIVTLLVVAKPKPQSQEEPPEPGLVQVSVVAAKKEDITLSVAAQGTVYPKREIDLVAQVGGQIVSTNADYIEGGFFGAEEQLVQIDPRDYEVALLEAKARVAEATRRLAEERGLARQAEREWRDLGNQQANDLFMRKPQLAAAEAAVAYAKADQAKAELNLARTKISVPFAGRIKAVAADLGQFVSPGAVVARVYDSSVYEVRVPLTESQAALIALPLTEDSAPSQVTVTGRVAGRSMQLQGQLVRADAFVDPDSRMYHAVVEIDLGKQPDELILPGIYVHLDIDGRPLSGVMKLPRAALYHGEKLICVGPDKRAKTYQAKVLKRDQQYVWLQADVAEGELIALEKQAILPDGTEVEPLTSTNTSLAKQVAQ